MTDVLTSKSESPICGDQLKLVYEHGQPHGIRDRGGYLMFFPSVTKYEGQEERYRNELAQRSRLADFLLRSLQQSGHETPAPTVLNAEGSALMMELFNRMPIKALRDDVPEDVQKRIGDFMVANGYRLVFDRWYLQAEPKEPDRRAVNGKPPQLGWTCLCGQLNLVMNLPCACGRASPDTRGKEP